MFLQKAGQCSNRMASILRAVAATATLAEEATKQTLGQKLKVLTPHQVQSVLEMKGYLRLTGNN